MPARVSVIDVRTTQSRHRLGTMRVMLLFLFSDLIEPGMITDNRD